MHEGAEGVGPGEGPQQQLGDDADRRAELLLSAARAIWPYVRFWGLCGASPDAIQAMLDLAAALGEEAIGVTSEAAAGIAEQAAADERQRIAGMVEGFASSVLLAQIGRNGAAKLAGELRDLIVNGQ